MNKIRIKGARTHNLKNLSLEIKLNAMTCIAGPSGSGKTSLAFHTLLKESKRRYLNSFPNDVKFFWDIPQTVDVDEIYPVLPVWGLPQNNPVVGSRLVVADHLDIHHDLEKLFFLKSRPVCPTHLDLPLERLSSSQRIEKEVATYFDLGCRVVHLILEKTQFEKTFGPGFYPARSYCLDQKKMIPFSKDSTFWEVLRVSKKSVKGLSTRIDEEFSGLVDSEVFVVTNQSSKLESITAGKKLSCPKCNYSPNREIDSSFELSPYNPIGACSGCDGHGMKLVYSRERLVREPHLSIKEGALYLLKYSRFEHLYPLAVRELKKAGVDVTAPFYELKEDVWKLLFDGVGKFGGLTPLLEYLESKRYKKNVRIYLRGLQEEVICDLCNGVRVDPNHHFYRLDGAEKSYLYKDVLAYNLFEFQSFLNEVVKDISQADSCYRIAKGLQSTVKTALDLNLGQLGLTSKVRRLVVGEYQRILLAKLIKYSGSGSLFVFDEPSTGLSQKEQKVLLNRMKELCKQGNTVIIVDHSDYLKKNADEVILMGPGAGAQGGEVIFQGAHKFLPKTKSPLGEVKIKKTKATDFLTVESKQAKLSIRLARNRINLLKGANTSSYQNIIMEQVPKRLSVLLDGRISVQKDDFVFKGYDFLKGVINIDGGIGRTTSRSTVGTLTGLAQQVRKAYTELEVSKKLNLQEGHFSSLSQLGQCPSCEGRGVKTVDMQFLEDLEFSCEDCKGKKIRPFYSSISNGHHTFHESINCPLDEVLDYIRLTPKFRRTWDSLKLLRLGYLSLDRQISSLSGGERLRLKFLVQLNKALSDQFILIENLSQGLSEEDLVRVFLYIQQLESEGNTVVLVDESPLLEKLCSYSLDLRK